MKENNDIVIYKTSDGLTKINVNINNDTVWLTLDQLSDLFARDKSTISRHIKNVFDEGELSKDSTVANFATVQKEGNRNVERNIEYYNLDVIISVGYRVKSQNGVDFRIWATNVLKEYMIKGFTMDDERLKGNAGGNYWKELLDRIRDIRSSEKVMYRQVLDLYATSIDYDPKSEESIKFFKIVQNKFHFAVHGHTASELIFESADAKKPFMGLKSFAGEYPVKSDVFVAKNYLDEKELKILNNLVSAYFDFAEISAIEHKPMCMSDYIEKLDKLLAADNNNILENSGTVSHLKAAKKANEEYKKYQERAITPVEKAYFETIDNARKQATDKI